MCGHHSGGISLGYLNDAWASRVLIDWLNDWGGWVHDNRHWSGKCNIPATLPVWRSRTQWWTVDKANWYQDSIYIGPHRLHKWTQQFTTTSFQTPELDSLESWEICRTIEFAAIAKSSYLHLEYCTFNCSHIILTPIHAHTRAHHPITARDINSSRSYNSYMCFVGLAIDGRGRGAIMCLKQHVYQTRKHTNALNCGIRRNATNSKSTHSVGLKRAICRMAKQPMEL